MKKLKGLCTVLGLLSMLLWGIQAQAYLPSEIGTMQDQARVGVEAALAQLESANESGDFALVTLASQLLELAVTNYAAITEYANSGAAATDTNNIICINCQAISTNITTICAQMVAGNGAGAKDTMAILQVQAASLPDNSGAEMPLGLADLEARINAALAAAATIIGNNAPAGAEPLPVNQPASKI